jgi:hypothetical protein
LLFSSFVSWGLYAILTALILLGAPPIQKVFSAAADVNASAEQNCAHLFPVCPAPTITALCSNPES